MKFPKTGECLNQIVADVTQSHMLVHQHHWYMLGGRFLKIHPYLDEVMDELLEQQDDVAERLIAIGGDPISTFEEVLDLTRIKDQKGNWNYSMDEHLQFIVDAYEQLKKDYEEGIKVSADEGDDSTNDLLIACHTAVEKRLWMMKAELGKRVDE